MADLFFSCICSNDISFLEENKTTLTKEHLSLAVKNGNTNVVKYLLSLNLPLTKKDIISFFIEACNMNMVDIFNTLLFSYKDVFNEHAHKLYLISLRNNNDSSCISDIIFSLGVIDDLKKNNFEVFRQCINYGNARQLFLTIKRGGHDVKNLILLDGLCRYFTSEKLFYLNLVLDLYNKDVIMEYLLWKRNTFLKSCYDTLNVDDTICLDEGEVINEEKRSEYGDEEENSEYEDTLCIPNDQSFEVFKFLIQKYNIDFNNEKLINLYKHNSLYMNYICKFCNILPRADPVPIATLYNEETNNTILPVASATIYNEGGNTEVFPVASAPSIDTVFTKNT
jgi:hypothetical protein